MHPLFQSIQLKKDSRSKVELFCRQWEDEAPISIQTSGSTGKPKVLHFTKAQFIVSAQKTQAFFHLHKNTKALLCLSPDSIGGKMMLVRALVGNYTLYITEPSLDPLEQLTEPIDFVALVPTQLAHILKNTSSLSKLKTVQNILIGGADISMELSEQLLFHGIKAYQSYGMTETVSHVALREIGKETAYQALPGIRFTATTDNCLTIHYPELLSQAIQTTDAVELLSEQSFLWKGRTDFVINSGGKKIHPEALEQRLSTYISGRFFLHSIPHPLWGEALVLVTEEPFSLKKTDLVPYFSSHEIPKFSQTVPMILTASGKIQRTLTFEQTEADAWLSL
jgi:O-succinylbenzoic acid--CoA ligase